MSAPHIPFRDLKTLPFTTLSIFAMEVAKDIEDGEENKRDLLEKIFDAMKKGR